jgi:hypothetical protein
LGAAVIHVAAGSYRRFAQYIMDHDLDLNMARYVHVERHLEGHRGGKLVILPCAPMWQELAMYARAHDMEVQVL